MLKSRGTQLNIFNSDEAQEQARQVPTLGGRGYNVTSRYKGWEQDFINSQSYEVYKFEMGQKSI